MTFQVACGRRGRWCQARVLEGHFPACFPSRLFATKREGGAIKQLASHTILLSHNKYWSDKMLFVNIQNDQFEFKFSTVVGDDCQKGKSKAMIRFERFGTDPDCQMTRRTENNDFNVTAIRNKFPAGTIRASLRCDSRKNGIIFFSPPTLT